MLKKKYTCTKLQLIFYLWRTLWRFPLPSFIHGFLVKYIDKIGKGMFLFKHMNVIYIMHCQLRGYKDGKMWEFNSVLLASQVKGLLCSAGRHHGALPRAECSRTCFWAVTCLHVLNKRKLNVFRRPVHDSSKHILLELNLQF